MATDDRQGGVDCVDSMGGRGLAYGLGSNEGGELGLGHTRRVFGFQVFFFLRV